MPFGLSDKTIEKLHSVFEDYGEVQKAILYGSRAKGNYKNGSDIDLVLSGGSNLTFTTLGHILDKIDDLLLPYTVDLAILEQITDQELLDHIKRVGVVFYEK